MNGRSDRQARRRVADCAADVATIADALKVEQFAVQGSSSGSDPTSDWRRLYAWLIDRRVNQNLSDRPVMRW
jgi:hypothetical protein